jgi:hypothetical protein
MIRAFLRAVAAEHTLALRAATKAASPRQNLAEVRAMYISPREPHQEAVILAQPRGASKIRDAYTSAISAVSPEIDVNAASTGAGGK